MFRVWFNHRYLKAMSDPNTITRESIAGLLCVRYSVPNEPFWKRTTAEQLNSAMAHVEVEFQLERMTFNTAVTFLSLFNRVAEFEGIRPCS